MSDTRPASFAVRTAVLAGVAAALIALGVLAQERRLRSPPGHSAVQVGGAFDPVQYGYLGGPWIDVYYGRPLKRGRDLFGPPDWAAMLNDGAPVWRAGANQSTRLVTEAPLIIGGARVEPGEYTLFIELSDDGWTFIVSTWPAQRTTTTRTGTRSSGPSTTRTTATCCGRRWRWRRCPRPSSSSRGSFST